MKIKEKGKSHFSSKRHSIRLDPELFPQNAGIIGNHIELRNNCKSVQHKHGKCVFLDQPITSSRKGKDFAITENNESFSSVQNEHINIQVNRRQ